MTGILLGNIFWNEVWTMKISIQKTLLTGSILLLLLVFSALASRADIVVLHDGRSYSGSFAGAPSGKLVFTDNQGIQYTFPIADVQSLVFSNLADHISLRTGHSYRGQLVGLTSLKFNGSNGVSYVFPINDVSSLIFTEDGSPTAGMSARAGAAAAAGMGSAQAYGARAASTNRASILVPSGTQISVRTDVPIDTTKDTAGQKYDATIQNDVTDSMGTISIPAGTRAKLQVVDASRGGIHGQAYALDLYSIRVKGANYLVDTTSIGGQEGVGLNKRTAIFGGGGLALGSLLGAAFGGGQGAAIGAVAGGLGGLGTQLFTHGKTVKVPAETVLSFQLQQTLVLHP